MGTNDTPESLPESLPDVATDVSGAVEQLYATDPRGVVDVSREAAAQFPEDAEEAFHLAYVLYPDSPEQREAFWNGFEFRFATGQQHKAGEALRAIVEGPAEPQHNRRWLRRRLRAGTQAALLTLGLFTTLPSARSKDGADDV